MIKRIITYICYLYLKLVYVTSKVNISGYHYISENENKKQPLIYALWHNKLFLAPYLGQNKDLYSLISASKDGEYLSLVASYFNINVVRGSTSKGGTRALVKLIKKIKHGSSAAITPDGPRGPKYSIQPGISFLAQKTNALVLPFSYSAKRKYIFSSWDNFELPYPFNQINVLFGEPVRFNKEQSVDFISKEIKKILSENLQKCDNLTH